MIKKNENEAIKKETTIDKKEENIEKENIKMTEKEKSRKKREDEIEEKKQNIIFAVFNFIFESIIIAAFHVVFFLVKEVAVFIWEKIQIFFGFIFIFLLGIIKLPILIIKIPAMIIRYFRGKEEKEDTKKRAEEIKKEKNEK